MCQYGVIEKIQLGTYLTHNKAKAVITEVKETGGAYGVIQHPNGWHIASWLEDGCRYKVYNHGWFDSESLKEFQSPEIPPAAAQKAREWEAIKSRCT